MTIALSVVAVALTIAARVTENEKAGILCLMAIIVLVIVNRMDQKKIRRK